MDAMMDIDGYLMMFIIMNYDYYSIFIYLCIFIYFFMNFIHGHTGAQTLEKCYAH